MSSAQFNAAQSHAEAQAKTEQFVDSSNSTMHSAIDTAESAADSAQQSAQMRREEQGGSGFLQQTGEQMISMAQGAIDGMKNTLGMGDQKK